eukprot:CAMPEP_0184373784 /NCGR_PEP_ID=MMETSP1089-20130417/164680_1 /TAXON_ID=38269 ORGANISM="Gloeochaete wittrockiana, Strain SAG46.84" /NCGR_SAMPLE_ID=MMETSP1089 /ASSEMBLY_ACC=CAM_ASM_000445 /LENGTH=646 /DNA_ID=CAMNT_0026716759 /DNA_START=47 /DNA_END=1984 /DNA_ORIENTATION=-
MGKIPRTNTCPSSFHTFGLSSSSSSSFSIPRRFFSSLETSSDTTPPPFLTNVQAPPEHQGMIEKEQDEENFEEEMDMDMDMMFQRGTIPKMTPIDVAMAKRVGEEMTIEGSPAVIDYLFWCNDLPQALREFGRYVELCRSSNARPPSFLFLTKIAKSKYTSSEDILEEWMAISEFYQPTTDFLNFFLKKYGELASFLGTEVVDVLSVFVSAGVELDQRSHFHLYRLMSRMAPLDVATLLRYCRESNIVLNAERLRDSLIRFLEPRSRQYERMDTGMLERVALYDEIEKGGIGRGVEAVNYDVMTRSAMRLDRAEILTLLLPKLSPVSLSPSMVLSLLEISARSANVLICSWTWEKILRMEEVRQARLMKTIGFSAWTARLYTYASAGQVEELMTLICKFSTVRLHRLIDKGPADFASLNSGMVDHLSRSIRSRELVDRAFDALVEINEMGSGVPVPRVEFPSTFFSSPESMSGPPELLSVEDALQMTVQPSLIVDFTDDHVNLKVSIDAYNVVLKGCAYARDISRCVQLFRNLRMFNLSPNTETYNSMLLACERVRWRENAELIIKQMKKNHVALNSETILHLITLYAEIGDDESLFRLIDEYPDPELIPSWSFERAIFLLSENEVSPPSTITKLVEKMVSIGFRP